MMTITSVKIFTPHGQLVIAQITQYELTIGIASLASTQFKEQETTCVELEKRKRKSKVESPLYRVVYCYI